MIFLLQIAAYCHISPQIVTICNDLGPPASICDDFFWIKKISFETLYSKSPVYFKGNYDNTDFMTMELLTTPCFIFFMSFLPSWSCFTPLIVLRVSLSLWAFCPALRDSISFHFEFWAFVSGSCQRNPIISVSCFQSFCSCLGESAMQESFWSLFISVVKSMIESVKSKFYKD